MKKSIRTIVLCSSLIFFSSCKELLLIPTAFFYFTTVTSQPTSMKLSFPKAEEDGKLMVADENTYTILLAKRKQPYVYNGLDIKREVLMKFKIGEGSYLNQCLILGKNTFGKNFKVIIKSSKDSDYKTLVDALDEVVINKIDSYALLDISKVEEAFLKNRYPTLQ